MRELDMSSGGCSYLPAPALCFKAYLAAVIICSRTLNEVNAHFYGIDKI